MRGRRSWLSHSWTGRQPRKRKKTARGGGLRPILFTFSARGIRPERNVRRGLRER